MAAIFRRGEENKPPSYRQTDGNAPVVHDDGGARRRHARSVHIQALPI
jgi:hypothetical protein